MKRKIFLSLVAVITALLCALGAVACKDDGKSSDNVSTLNGVYYNYVSVSDGANDKFIMQQRYVLKDGKYDMQMYSSKNGGEWSNFLSGSYSVKNGNLVLEMESGSTTINRVEEKCFKTESTMVNGKVISYICIEDKIPSDIDKTQIDTEGIPQELLPSVLK